MGVIVMLIFGMLFLLLVLCIIIGSISDSQDVQDVWFVITLVVTICIIGGVIAIPLKHMEYKSNINKFISVQSTLDTARLNGDTINDATLQLSIVDSNKWLASAQYYNNTVFDIWIPDEVMELKPIK